MLGIRVSLLYPERVEKLILVNPLGLEDWKLTVPYRTPDEVYVDELRLTPKVIREHQQASYYAGRWTPEFESLTTLEAGWTRHLEYPRIAWCSALIYDMIFTQPVIYELPYV